jgi:chromosome segregation ATPase
VETSGNHYRFELKLPASATASLSVEEEHVFETTVSVSGLSADALLVHVQNKSISEAGRKQLQKMADLKRQIASEDAEIRRLQNEIDQIGRDQQRIRENINSLNRVAGQQEQVQRYAKQLAEQEARLAGLRDGQEAARQKKQALESELNRLIETAVF